MLLPRNHFLAFILLSFSLLAACTSAAPETAPENTPPIPAQANSPTPAPTISATPALTSTPSPSATQPPPTTTSTSSPIPSSTASATPLPAFESLGLSTLNYPIDAYHLGSGEQQVMVVGGMHGGYEWNSILLAYELLIYFEANPVALPDHIRLTIIPSTNPDGQVWVTGTAGRFAPNDVSLETAPGRFNGNNVDLNRNWPCNWQPTGNWAGQVVSAGAEPFSEIENRHLNYFITIQEPDLVIFLHSALSAVVLSDCNGIVADGTVSLGTAYAEAAAYTLYETFPAYPVYGDAADTLALSNIAAFTVELTDHFNTEFERNLDGLRAVFETLDQPDP